MDDTARVRRAIGTGVAGVAVLLGLVNVIALLAVGRQGLLLSPDALIPLTVSGVGLLVVRKVPRNPVGWLLLSAATSSALFGASALLVMHAARAPEALVASAAWLSAWVWLPSYLIGFWFLPMLFPDGRAVSARWRPVVLTSVVLLAAEVFLLAFGSPTSVEPSVPNPLVLEPVGAVLRVVEPAIYVSMSVLVILGVGSLLHRFRRSQGLPRVQVLCVLVAAALGTGYYALTRSGLLLAMLLPVAIAVAVLRFRLYDVERLLGRTIVYGGLAGTASILYVGIVLAAGHYVGAERDLRLQAIAIAIAVLLVHPLHGRFMALAQRLVYGKRSKPYEALAQLARRVGSALSPDDTLPGMAEAIAGALQTRSVTVTAALPDGGATSCSLPATDLREVEGAVVERRVVHQGMEVGSIRIVRDAPFNGQESALLDVLVAQSGPSLHAVALTAQLREQLSLAIAQASELRSSRARLVSAHDAARRVIERDLHDGAQQGLLAIAVQLGRVQRKITSDPSQASHDIAELQDLARRTLVELRALAAGTYPPVLHEFGLAAAVRERTEGATPTVAVHDDFPSRPSPAVETALYFACMEAITNALKHAGSSRIDVRLTHAPPRAFGFTICDDGHGFDTETATRGTGMTGMADRLGVFNGSVRVMSRLGAGTTVIGIAYDEVADRYSRTA